MQQKNADEVLRARRWANFRRRADCAPSNVYYHPTRGWEYIPTHPFGDELDALKRLCMQPDEVVSAGAWWGIDGDATRLESCVVTSSDTPSGLVAMATPDEQQWVYLFALFDAPYVTRAAFEDAMGRFADLGFPYDSRFRLRWGDPRLELWDGQPAA
jgi:hypothetical protein